MNYKRLFVQYNLKYIFFKLYIWLGGANFYFKNDFKKYKERNNLRTQKCLKTDKFLYFS